MRALAIVLLALAVAGCDNGSPLPLVGTLERERVVLSAPVSERIVEISVDEGDTIAAGTLVARLDSKAARERLAAAEAEADRLAARLAELEAGPRAQELRAARARLAGDRETLRLAERTLERLRRLAAKELASPSDVDDAERVMESARAERDIAAARLDELEAGTRGEQLSQARAALAAARAEVRRARTELEDLALVTLMAARVESLPLNIGERPRAGEPVAVLLAGPAYARVYIPAGIRPRFKVGMAAQVAVAGGATHDARIRTIAGEAAFTPFFALTERDRDRLAYRAEIELVDDAADLPIGAPVEVSFPGLGVAEE